MHTHGEVQNEVVHEHIVMNSDYDKSGKVIEFSRLEKYVVKKVYCGKCEEWMETDSRDIITDYLCPNCCTNWK